MCVCSASTDLDLPGVLPIVPMDRACWSSGLRVKALARVHACLEATGTYSDAIATFLFEHGHQVSIINPARVTAFRVSEGIRTKTDRHDALVLARFCEQ